MKKVLSIIFVLALVSLSSAQYDGHWFGAADRAGSEAIGYSDTYFADASAGNCTIPTSWTNGRGGGTCRAISADSTGLVKIAYTSENGVSVIEVVMLIGGVLRPVRNITLVYQYYTGTTAGTCKSYNADGTAKTNAIKLHR